MRRTVLHWACVFALGVVALVGCQEVVQTVELSVTATESGSGAGLAGVDVCETDTGNCATTDQLGVARIFLPPDQAVSYTLSKDGYVPYLIGDVTDETFRDSGPWPMAGDATAAEWADALMFPYPPWTVGLIQLRAFPPREGVTFDLVDETSRGYYLDEAGAPTLGLVATTTNGSGGFVELSTGEYEAEFGGTVTNCTPDLGWPGDAANRIKVPVRAGYFTFGSMNCDTL